jgi:hypothetical protein
MKVMQINRDSWHFKLAKKFGGLNTYKHDDFCSYTRRVLLGSLALFGCLLVAVLAAYLVSSGVFFVYLRVTLGHWPKDGWYAIGGMFDAIILMVCAIFGGLIGVGILVEKRIEYKKEQAAIQECADDAYFDKHGVYPTREVKRSFVKEAYASFKEKTCYRLNIN